MGRLFHVSRPNTAKSVNVLCPWKCLVFCLKICPRNLLLGPDLWTRCDGNVYVWDDYIVCWRWTTMRRRRAAGSLSCHVWVDWETSLLKTCMTRRWITTLPLQPAAVTATSINWCRCLLRQTASVNSLTNTPYATYSCLLKPNTHADVTQLDTPPTRRNCRVASRRRCVMNSQLTHDDCRRIRWCERSRRPWPSLQSAANAIEVGYDVTYDAACF